MATWASSSARARGVKRVAQAVGQALVQSLGSCPQNIAIGSQQRIAASTDAICACTRTTRWVPRALCPHASRAAAARPTCTARRPSRARLRQETKVGCPIGASSCPRGPAILRCLRHTSSRVCSGLVDDGAGSEHPREVLLRALGCRPGHFCRRRRLGTFPRHSGHWVNGRARHSLSILPHLRAAAREQAPHEACQHARGASACAPRVCLNLTP